MNLKSFLETHTDKELELLLDDYLIPNIPQNSNLRSICLTYYGDESLSNITEIVLIINQILAERQIFN